tara:strand:- start:19198 stop:19593 length:396 start_codon:yes stop_codon:yes gene_type:complete
VEKDEKMVETLTRFCKKNNIWNAQLSGIGAVKSVDIGAYDTNKKEYIRHKLPEVWELVNCQGNVILKDEEPFIHVHVTLSDHNLNTKGGHLFESTIAAVGEFFVRKLDSQVSRKFDIDIGLPCLSLEKKFK